MGQTLNMDALGWIALGSNRANMGYPRWRGLGHPGWKGSNLGSKMGHFGGPRGGHGNGVPGQDLAEGSNSGPLTWIGERGWA